MARKNNRIDYGFSQDQLDTAVSTIIGKFEKDGSVTPGSHYGDAAKAVEQAYDALMTNKDKLGKSGQPSTTDVARLGYENFLKAVPNATELIEQQLVGAAALEGNKLAAFTWDFTGEGEDDKFNEIARMHVACRLIAKGLIKARKIEQKAAEALARQQKAADKEKATTEANVNVNTDGNADGNADGKDKETTTTRAKSKKEPVAAGNVAVE